MTTPDHRSQVLPRAVLKMKTAAAYLGAFLAGTVPTANAVGYEVASCADLSLVDEDTVTVLTVTSSTLVCSKYTRFRVRNGMILSAVVPEVTFSNFAFKVLGELTVEPDVIFKDVYLQVLNGYIVDYKSWQSLETKSTLELLYVSEQF